jgi:hypothetical protein
VVGIENRDGVEYLTRGEEARPILNLENKERLLVS